MSTCVYVTVISIVHNTLTGTLPLRPLTQAYVTDPRVWWV